MTNPNQPSASTLYKMLALTMERSGLFGQTIDRRPKRKLRGWRIKAAMARVKRPRCYHIKPHDQLRAGETINVDVRWLTQ